MADELYGIQSWAFDRIAADTGAGGVYTLVSGRIYVGAAPEGAAFPLVLIKYISPILGDLMFNGGGRVWTRARFLITAVTNKRSFQAISAAVSRLDTILHEGEGSGTGTSILQCLREAPYQRGIIENGVSYSEAGAYWDIIGQAS